MDIVRWASKNELSIIVHDDKFFSIGDKKFLLISDKEVLVDENFSIILSDEEADLRYECTHFAFMFGESYYMMPSDQDKVELTPLKYVGSTEDTVSKFPYLGVHGKYEMCNGSRDYSDWCLKAKFLGVESLGICEKNTLAGVLSFQMDCDSNGIKPIIGETVTVSYNDSFFDIKLYVKDYAGWRNLLKINKLINVDNDGHVMLDDIVSNREGLILVIGANEALHTSIYDHIESEDTYVQIDPVEFNSPDKDRGHISDMWEAINSKKFNPAIICDSYYLDKEDSHIKRKLNKIGKIGFEYASDDQYFKSFRQIYQQLKKLYGPDRENLLKTFFFHARKNTSKIGEKCEFKFPIGELHLPEYEMSEDQKENYEDNLTLFSSIVKSGFNSKVVEKIGDKSKSIDEYMGRVEKEFDLIYRGGFIDYFLILWDIIRWCEEEDIMVGVGRGSAGGSLISYLMNITKLDPLEHDLLFERFLNESRINSSLPDIDCDFAGKRRDDVKEYMRKKYGYDHVVSIGTYGTLKVRAALKDLARLSGIDHNQMNYVTSMLSSSGSDIASVFIDAVAQGGRANNKEDAPLIKFIRKNPDIINDVALVINQPKNASIHAAGMIITPKKYKGEDMTVFDWIPVKKMDGFLVTEWEGPQLEAAGFLKEDILGLAQLDKFKQINDLLEKMGKEVPTFESISYDDKDVYKLFHKGYNQDLFHFGSSGLTSYSVEVKPNNLDDLVAMISLQRPGAMESNAHNHYVSIRNGHKQPEYDLHLKEVTKDTFGLYVYQEQIMKACQIIGGFTLAEADGVRKAMGKKIVSKMEEYGDRFMKGAVDKGYTEIDAHRLWNKLAAFAGYGFNKSHAVAYSMTGYMGQYYKKNYPLEFWTVAIQEASEDEVPYYINEIYDLNNGIKIMPPDINESNIFIKADFETNKIYWSINKIKFAGESAVSAIISEREENGKYFSLEEFYERVPKKKVNKRCLLNLILSGCFDQIENVREPKDRMRIVSNYMELTDTEEFPIPATREEVRKNYFWTIQQKNLSGLGVIDYTNLVFTESESNGHGFIDGKSIYLDSSLDKRAVCAGILLKITERNSRNGKFAVLTLDHNSHVFDVTLWADTWAEYKKQAMSSWEGRVVIISGTIRYDNFKNKNSLFTDNYTTIEIL